MQTLAGTLKQPGTQRTTQRRSMETRWLVLMAFSVAIILLIPTLFILPPHANTVNVNSRVAAWHGLIGDATMRRSAEIHRVTSVNQFVNRARLVRTSQGDLWAGPLELLDSDSGDARAFVVAKYVTLRELGIPEEKLFVVHVTQHERNQPHVVLAYVAHDGAEPLILDSLVAGVKPASAREDLVPVYSSRASVFFDSRKRAGRSPQFAGL